MSRGLGETRITDLTQQVQTVDRKVEDLGTKIDKIDVKFEQLKQLIMGFQNHGSTVVNSESDATSKEDTEVNSTCMEEVNHSNFFRPFTNNNKFESVEGIAPATRQTSTCHTLHSTCKVQVHNRRPAGRQEPGDIRCPSLERVAESVELLCKYHTLGCPEIFPSCRKLGHEEVCNFRPYNCPYAGSDCAVNGNVSFLVSHLRDDHQVGMHTGSTFNQRYVKSNPREVTNATWMLTVFDCFGQYFCLHFEAFQLGMAPVYMAFLRFMGDEADARNYSYSLEVGGNGSKVTWEGTPRSIRDSHGKVRDSLDGLIIQRNMALFFSGGERKELKLRVTGRIWKEEQNSEAGACNTKSL